MRLFMSLILATLLLTSVAFAGSKPKTYDGYIAKLDKNRINIELRDANNQPYRVQAYTDGDTVVTLEGKPARLRDLTPRMHVVLTMRNNIIAGSIDANAIPNDWKRK